MEAGRVAYLTALPPPREAGGSIGFIVLLTLRLLDRLCDYSAKVSRPHMLGLPSMRESPVQAIWGMYSVPGQG